jgi:tetratricopeptide (TPR) repeat protein
MGNAYYFLKDYPKAIDGYQKAVAIYPGLEDNHKNLAIAYRDYGRFWGEMKGNFEEAKKYLDLAIKENPKDIETYRIIGVAYGALKGDNVNAMAAFQKMIELKPDDAAGYYNMHIAYNVVGDKEKAQAMLTETLKRDPKFIEKVQKNPSAGSETPK